VRDFADLDSAGAECAWLECMELSVEARMVADSLS